MTYTIGKVTTMTHVSVRTLHYYDAIDLLNPSYETASGYRLYDDGDLELLQQVLFFRALGFPLAQIKAIVQSPAFDRRKALEAHRTALLERRRTVDALLAAVDHTIEAMGKGEAMDKKEMFDAFDERALEEHRTKYAEEAKQRWGMTDAYAESQKRTSKYTKEDWARIQQEMAQIDADMAVLMDRKVTDPDVQDVVRRKHEYFNHNFYTCSAAMLAGLSEMWVSDARFTATYDKIKPGLAQFWYDAVQICCTNSIDK
ncbi:MAG TPA: MerR family transcriptional regulator [Clostridia bacterium]|nr:MerR family transcriptional regulator [Clostridia bacterium]